MTTTTGIPKPAFLPYSSVNTGATVGASLGYVAIGTAVTPFSVILPPIPALSGAYMNIGAVTYVRKNNDTVVMTLTVAGGGTIDGSATFVVPDFTTCMFVTTGTEYTLWKTCVNGEPPAFSARASMPAVPAETPGEPIATPGEPESTPGEPTATPGELEAAPSAADAPESTPSAADTPSEAIPPASGESEASVSASDADSAAPVAESDFVVIDSPPPPPSAPLNRGK